MTPPASGTGRDPGREIAINADLEILRAIAIAFTLAAHLLWPVLPKMGEMGRKIHALFQFWTGVDLFFAISGFIITLSLLRQFSCGRSGDPGRPGPDGLRGFLRMAAPFWIRRVFRLLPSAWLWIGITLLLTAGFNSHGSFGTWRNNASEALAAVFNVANFYFYAWFARGHSISGSLGVYWSLSLEEQFYLALPFLLFFMRRRWLVGTLAGAFAVQFFLHRPSGFTPQGAGLPWFVRTDALILGVLIALWKEHLSYRVFDNRITHHRLLAQAAVVAGVVALGALPAAQAAKPFSTGWVAIVSGLLVLIASCDRNCIMRPSRAREALLWLGSRSYSIYIIHVVGRASVLEVKKSVGIPEGGVLAALASLGALVFTLALAELNYRCIEVPFRRLGRRLAGSGEVELKQKSLARGDFVRGKRLAPAGASSRASARAIRTGA